MGLEQRYHSLDDFLASKMSHIDGALDDGWGYSFPVKGYETEATILFADISGFSTRTMDMSPSATLVFVQNFFAWITAEALQGRPGIVDKYIGDEVMVVFAEDFGSEDPFADAVSAAAAMSRHDVHAYCPHIGIASGRVIVGYAGTPLRYNVSVFGHPVALAARCAAVRPPKTDEPLYVSSTIVVPEHEWGDRSLGQVLTGVEHDDYPIFELQLAREVPMKGLGEVPVREIYNTGMHLPSLTAENRALDSLHALYEGNRYWPRWEAPAPSGGQWSHVTPLDETDA
ncbi:MAG TPA: adenylate/guanylate cyclase domain-containing protein [Frankiaceae bacterium]|nr:adenylate/guanylate cyclase domain-containing protein [Frankiaceae bacterium]